MHTTRFKNCFFLCALLNFLINNPLFAGATHLTPPWELLQPQLNALLQSDPCITVNHLSGAGTEMEISIIACKKEKALALATFLNKRHEFNDQLAVSVTIYAPDLIPVEMSVPEDLEEITRLLNIALNGNKHFIKTGMSINPFGQPVAYAVFTPSIIQYYSDDIGDWYSNTNEVAAKEFSKVFNLNPFDDKAIKIFATTAPTRTK